MKKRYIVGRESGLEIVEGAPFIQKLHSNRVVACWRGTNFNFAIKRGVVQEFRLLRGEMAYARELPDGFDDEIREADAEIERARQALKDAHAARTETLMSAIRRSKPARVEVPADLKPGPKPTPVSKETREMLSRINETFSDFVGGTTKR